jgi:hypothetical protein
LSQLGDESAERKKSRILTPTHGLDGKTNFSSPSGHGGDQGVFEAKAKVVYCDPRFGMGLAFTEMTPDQRSLLEAWIAEIVSQLRTVS